MYILYISLNEVLCVLLPQIVKDLCSNLPFAFLGAKISFPKSSEFFPDYQWYRFLIWAYLTWVSFVPIQILHYQNYVLWHVCFIKYWTPSISKQGLHQRDTSNKLIWLKENNRFCSRTCQAANIAFGASMSSTSHLEYMLLIAPILEH